MPILITIQHYRYDTMGSERQWLPHGQYKKTYNIQLAYNYTTND